MKTGPLVVRAEKTLLVFHPISILKLSSLNEHVHAPENDAESKNSLLKCPLRWPLVQMCDNVRHCGGLNPKELFVHSVRVRQYYYCDLYYTPIVIPSCTTLEFPTIQEGYSCSRFFLICSLEEEEEEEEEEVKLLL